jgi:hypothetical protein
MGSYMMLSDENTLDNINPFVTGGPGAISKPFGYAPSAPIKDSGTWDPTQSKPLCEWGVQANSNGSFLTEGCLPPKNPQTCYMERALEPTRDIVPDLYTLIPYKEPIPKSLQRIEKKETIHEMVIPAAVLLIILTFFILRRK